MKLLESYFIEQLEDNLTLLTINLRNKSTELFQMGGGNFWLSDEQEDIEHQEEKIQQIEDLKDCFSFTNRNKDQVLILYVPTYKLTNNEKRKAWWKEKEYEMSWIDCEWYKLQQRYNDICLFLAQLKEIRDDK